MIHADRVLGQGLLQAGDEEETNNQCWLRTWLRVSASTGWGWLDIHAEQAALGTRPMIGVCMCTHAIVSTNWGRD